MRASLLSLRSRWSSLLAVAVLSIALPAATVHAQRVAPGSPDEMVVQAYTFRYQTASEAVQLVYPLLSPRGTVEVQPKGNTLVLRDTRAAIDRILPALRSFDHAARPLRLEVFLVKASRTPVSPPIRRSDLPEWLTRRLRDLLAYDIFEMQAQAQLSGLEGQKVTYDLGQEYRVSFRFGTVLEGGRTKLNGFRISRPATDGKAEAVLIQTSLNLWVDRTTSLGLAKSEASREALMVVLTLRQGDAPRTNGGGGR